MDGWKLIDLIPIFCNRTGQGAPCSQLVISASYSKITQQVRYEGKGNTLGRSVSVVNTVLTLANLYYILPTPSKPKPLASTAPLFC